MALPPGCRKCNGDLFVFIGSGMARCDNPECQRGLALRAADVARTTPPVAFEDFTPVLSEDFASACVSVLAGNMDYFPPDFFPRAKIADEIRAMCHDEREADWLVTIMVRLYSKWPGLPSLRQVYCSRWVPLDRVPAVGVCPIYPDGPPISRRVETPAVRALLPPAEYRAQIEAVGQSKELVVRRDFWAGWRRVRDACAPIKPADIERARAAIQSSNGGQTRKL